jgi:outer membrane protein TolC
MHRFHWTVLPLVVAMTSACAPLRVEQDIAQAGQVARIPGDAALTLQRTAQQAKAAAEAADALLAQPLSQDAAVRLMLLNSPAMQAMLASHWADAAQAARTGRAINPVLTLERVRSLDEVELGRQLSFGLLSWLTWPQRMRQAEMAQQSLRVSLSMQVVTQIHQVRQAWVLAVSALQQQAYAQRVHDVAQASSELAARMAKAGNFSALQRDTQQLFFADAVAQLGHARHTDVRAREALVRLLGLNSEQTKRLQLPEKLPDVPTQLTHAETLAAQGNERLDVQLAQAQYDGLVSDRGATVLGSLTEVELGIRRDRVKNRAQGSTERKQGEEIQIRLPVFDTGDLEREQLDARVLAARQQLLTTVRQAESSLRERYSAYRAAHELAMHYQQSVLPLRERMSRQQLRRYNGMLIGVFELLDDARDQVHTVVSAQQAQEQFWLADASLQAALLGAEETQP